MKKQCVFVCMLLTLIVLSACRKQDYPRQEPLPLTKKELLTQKKWKLVNFGFDNNNNGAVDADEDVAPDCVKDNIHSFFADGTGTVEENVLFCNNLPPISHFQWAFRNNDTQIDFFTSVADLQTLSAEIMILSYPINGSPGSSGSDRLLVTYKHP